MPQPMHDSLPPLSWQLQALIQEGWEQEVLSHLPATSEQQARRLGAFVRARGLSCVGDLLRGLLAYVLCASSLRQLGAWAVLIGLANLSHVAWQKRLRRARGWLLWLLSELLAVAAPPPVVAQRRIVLIDATRLKEPGGCGDDWRVHLGYDLLAGRLLDVKISDRHTAEGFTLFDLRTGDVVVADRGYCRRGQLAYVLRSGAHLVVRLAVFQLPLLDERGQPFDVLAWLKERGSGHHSCLVAFEHEGGRFLGRLIACSLPEEAAERARAKERKKANKKQRQLKEETLYVCGWVLLFTSLAANAWSDEQVLTLYRARWQIELLIKRMKQLLKLAQLRGKTALTNEATILALLLAWALLQPEVEQARHMLTEAAEHWALAHCQANSPEPPPAPSLPTVSSWTVTGLCVQTLRQLVQGFWTFARLQSCLPCLQRFLLSHRRQRQHQESTIRRQLLAHLGPLTASSSSLFFCSSA
ncbi:MAG: transposase [Ktedonobacteraceae bacterium]